MGMVATTDQYFHPGTGRYYFNETLKVFEWNERHIEQFKKDMMHLMNEEFNNHYKGIRVYKKSDEGDEMFKFNFEFQMYFLKDYSKLYLYYKIPDEVTCETDQYCNFYQIFNNRFYQLAKQDYGWELRVVTKDFFIENPKKRNRYVEVYHNKMPIYTTGLWFNRVYWERYEFIQDKVVFYNMIEKALVGKTEHQREQIMNDYFQGLVDINKNHHFTGGVTEAKAAYSEYKTLMSEMFDVTLPNTAINKCEYWYYELDMMGTREDREEMNERIL